MPEEITYFWNTSDLSQIVAEHPEYTKIYVCFKKTGDKSTSGDQSEAFKLNKTVLSLSKDKGDFLYLVSNINHDDIKKYFSLSELAPAKPEPVKSKAILEPVKKAKQQTLEAFFKKSK